MRFTFKATLIMYRHLPLLFLKLRLRRILKYNWY